MGLAKVWVFAEVAGDGPAPMVLELLTKARSLGDRIEAMVLSPNATAVAATLGNYGATTVFTGTNPAYGELLLGGPAADVMAALIAEHRPDLVLMGSTYTGRDVAGRLAAKLGLPVVTNVLDVATDGAAITATSSIFGGTQMVTTRFDAKGPALVLVRAKSFAAEPAGSAAPAVIPVDIPISPQHLTARIVERVAEVVSGPKLEDAAIVIGGGRGLGEAKNFELLETLAQLVHGAVGATRAVVDAGWVPYSLQVGQTGKTVKPQVYLACGISGAMQHTVGMKGSASILAINKDPDAPIFKLADLGIVGDAVKILPQVIEELKARLN